MTGKQGPIFKRWTVTYHWSTSSWLSPIPLRAWRSLKIGINVLVKRIPNDKTREGYNVDNLEDHLSNIKRLSFSAGTGKKIFLVPDENIFFPQKSFLQCITQLKIGKSYMGIQRACDLRFIDRIGVPLIWKAVFKIEGAVPPAVLPRNIYLGESHIVARSDVFVNKEINQPRGLWYCKCPTGFPRSPGRPGSPGAP